MNNSISHNRRKTDNTISSFSFHWKARFLDDSIINQFKENGSENRFQLVEDKFKDLRYFYLTNNIDKTFCIDLINGLIFFNNHQSIVSKGNKNNIRLIYFRRNKVEIGIESLKEESHIIIYHLGFQWNDEFGYNRKIILKIDNEGNWVLGE